MTEDGKSEVPPSDEVADEAERRNQRRLVEYLAGHQATETIIDIKAALSEALNDGIPKEAILADFGGAEEVERTIGTEEFKKLFG